MKFATASNFTEPHHSTYSPDSGSEIHSEFVISRRPDGSVLSRYKDDVWDLSPYSVKRHTLSFISWTNNNSVRKEKLVIQLRDEAKRLLWHKMFKPIGKGKRTKSGSFVEWFVVLRKVLCIALHLDLTLLQCATDARFSVSLRSSISQVQGRGTLGPIRIFLKDIVSINTQYSESCPQMILTSEQLSYYIILIESAINKSADGQRTPLIPSRIMASLIHQCFNQINTLYPHKDNLLALSKRYWKDTTFYCQSYFASQQRGGSRSIKQRLTSPAQALAEYGLTGIVNIPVDQPKANLRFKAWLARQLCLVRVLIHAFTGMRDHEVRVMSHDCFEKVEIPNIGLVPLIKSHTSKLEKDNYSIKPKYWATSNELEKVIDLARILSLCQILFQTRGNFNVDDYNLQQTPLWASGQKEKAPPIHYDLCCVDHSLWLSTLSWFDTVNDPNALLITDSDRAELEAFDAFNDWSVEKFNVGNMWPFATHQFRRSVAVYAARSGMVSLPALGTQYKHLNFTMTQLYAENSAFAEHFVRDERGSIPEAHRVVEQFDYAKALNKAIAFEESVINTAHKLVGASGATLQRLKDKGELVTFLGDRDDITRKIASGELSYVETDVGGCMRKTMCSKYGVALIVPCVSGCKDAVIGGDGGKKLRDYKESLEFSLGDLDKNSRPYYSLQKEIDHINIKLIEITN
ncbi:hypothetical protein [Yersinia frederiksenii]|uniref:hypothetical protein n=1 Tax=Yersinia frederiksenii TaxID=29484 RepID=UPI0005DD3546|nr:hypothetical protein [Yersinia frederiksenii]CQH38004.1 Uncharacterised protein [Yersinia frederiksenii]